MTTIQVGGRRVGISSSLVPNQSHSQLDHNEGGEQQQQLDPRVIFQNFFCMIPRNSVCFSTLPTADYRFEAELDRFINKFVSKIKFKRIPAFTKSVFVTGNNRKVVEIPWVFHYHTHLQEQPITMREIQISPDWHRDPPFQLEFTTQCELHKRNGGCAEDPEVRRWLSTLPNLKFKIKK
jgi:hypothetical protein